MAELLYLYFILVEAHTALLSLLQWQPPRQQPLIYDGDAYVILGASGTADQHSSLLSCIETFFSVLAGADHQQDICVFMRQLEEHFEQFE